VSVAPLAIVTGGKRRLGAAIAGRLAEAGYALALVSHLDKSPEAALLSILDQQKTEWQAFVADLSDPENASQLINTISAHFGRVPDLLVNNAAAFGQDDWQSMTAETLETHFRLNMFTPLLLIKALVVASGEHARPAIVNILDQRIVNPHGDQFSYTLSKQALAVSVRSAATAFGARARVNGVGPGLVIATDDYDSDQEARLARLMPLHSLPSPSGVAEAVLYLAQAQDVTGQTIFVDSGAHLKSFDRDFMHL
jgi:NAD(P)-dependent dehydrogenase (short-subunit alcohol dehydrogenase family)